MRPAPPKRFQHSRFPPRIYVSQGGDPARPMPRRNQCREESVAGIALGRLHDESPVDLDLAERHPIERPELGIPRAEVVQGQAYPHHAQPRHRFHRLHGLAEDFCLGQFDDEPVRGNPMLRQRRRESLENGRLLQRPSLTFTATASCTPCFSQAAAWATPRSMTKWHSRLIWSNSTSPPP